MEWRSAGGSCQHLVRKVRSFRSIGSPSALKHTLQCGFAPSWPTNWPTQPPPKPLAHSQFIILRPCKPSANHLSITQLRRSGATTAACCSCPCHCLCHCHCPCRSPLGRIRTPGCNFLAAFRQRADCSDRRGTHFCYPASQSPFHVLPGRTLAGLTPFAGPALREKGASN